MADPLTVAGLGIAGANALFGGKAQGEANRISREALELERQREAERQPFRKGLRESLGRDIDRPDLSGVFQSSNPFSRPFDASGIPGVSGLQLDAPVPVAPMGGDPAIKNVDELTAALDRLQGGRAPIDPSTLEGPASKRQLQGAFGLGPGVDPTRQFAQPTPGGSGITVDKGQTTQAFLDFLRRNGGF